METRDILKDEIERLGRALGKILAKFMELKNNGKVDLGIEVTNEELNIQLDLDIRELDTIPLNNLDSYLSGKKLSATHIGQLADYLIELGDHAATPSLAISYYERALAMYAIATRHSKIYPFERTIKEQRVRQKITECYEDL